MIHPETWASFDNLNGLNDLRRGEPLQVAPTASTRTVLTTETPANVPRHFVKLHYPRRISRFKPQRVVHRDLDVWVDAGARKQAGLEVLAASIGLDMPCPREQHYSLIYDRFIGRELFAAALTRNLERKSHLQLQPAVVRGF